jgi:hypothetical protein
MQLFGPSATANSSNLVKKRSFDYIPLKLTTENVCKKLRSSLNNFFCSTLLLLLFVFVSLVVIKNDAKVIYWF